MASTATAPTLVRELKKPDVAADSARLLRLLAAVKSQLSLKMLEPSEVSGASLYQYILLLRLEFVHVRSQ